MSAAETFIAPTREQRRSRRKRAVRGKTISVARMPKREIERGRREYPEQPGVDYARPATRGECVDGPRPCVFCSCKYNLYLDVDGASGALKLHFPDLEPGDLAESCALDAADRGGATLEQVGAYTNLTRERIRQLEVTAREKMRAALREHAEPPAPRAAVHLRVLQGGRAPLPTPTTAAPSLSPSRSMASLLRHANTCAKRVWHAVEHLGLRPERAPARRATTQSHRGRPWQFTGAEGDAIAAFLSAVPPGQWLHGLTGERTRKGEWGTGQKPKACAACGTSERPHYAKGRCQRCYRRPCQLRRPMPVAAE